MHITSITIILTCFIIGTVRADEAYAKEVISIQEDFLSSITPRPTGEDLSKHQLYPELVRRVSLLHKNWVHQKKGKDDALKQDLSVMALPNQSDVDKKYLEILQTELGFALIPIPDKLDEEARIFYTYGFNSAQLDRAAKKFGKEKLRALILRSAYSLGYKSASSNSLLFVPWRFSETTTAIQGLNEAPQ